MVDVPSANGVPVPVTDVQASVEHCPKAAVLHEKQTKAISRQAVLVCDVFHVMYFIMKAPLACNSDYILTNSLKFSLPNATLPQLSP